MSTLYVGSGAVMRPEQFSVCLFCAAVRVGEAGTSGSGGGCLSQPCLFPHPSHHPHPVPILFPTHAPTHVPLFLLVAELGKINISEQQIMKHVGELFLQARPPSLHPPVCLDLALD